MDELDEEGPDAAAEAFAQLEARIEQMRGEVALMRRAVESVAAERISIDVPDYSETLGVISNNLTATAQRVDMLAKSATQGMTATHIGNQIVMAGTEARRSDQRLLAEARAELDQATRQLGGYVVSARKGDEQNRWLAWTVFAGILVGIVLWVALGGALLRATPDSWWWPERMAARTLGGSEWQGARRLAGASYPDTWNAMVTGVVIGRGNEDALERCQRAATKAGEPVRCTVRIRPEERR